jgi:hypothetical protein
MFFYFNLSPLFDLYQKGVKYDRGSLGFIFICAALISSEASLSKSTKSINLLFVYKDTLNFLSWMTRNWHVQFIWGFLNKKQLNIFIIFKFRYRGPLLYK